MITAQDQRKVAAGALALLGLSFIPGISAIVSKLFSINIVDPVNVGTIVGAGGVFLAYKLYKNQI